MKMEEKMNKKEREYLAKQLSKAEDWKEARRKETRTKRKEEITEFINSPRGHYIISQALCIAVDELRSKPERERENSNIMDMEYILCNCFPVYRNIQERLKKEEKR